MKPADLARSAKISNGIISRALSGDRTPSPNTLLKIAKALKIPHEEVFRQADILPPNEPPDPWAEEMAALVNSLQNPLYREAAQILIEGFIKKEEKERRKQGKQ